MSKKVLHKRSVVVEGGQPKLPTSAQTDFGEIAINYAAGYETLSIRNNSNQIVPFSADHIIESKINTRISGITMNGSALTVSGGVVDLGSVMGEDEEYTISAALNELNTKVNKEITGITLNGSAMTVSGAVVNLGNLMDESDEFAVTTALNNLNTGLTAVTNTVITGMSSVNARLADCVTGVSMNGSAKTVNGGVVALGTVVTGVTMNGATKTITNGVLDLGNIMTEDNDYVIATALNDLNDRMGDVETILASI